MSNPGVFDVLTDGQADIKDALDGLTSVEANKTELRRAALLGELAAFELTNADYILQYGTKDAIKNMCRKIYLDARNNRDLLRVHKELLSVTAKHFGEKIQQVTRLTYSEPTNDAVIQAANIKIAKYVKLCVVIKQQLDILVTNIRSVLNGGHIDTLCGANLHGADLFNERIISVRVVPGQDTTVPGQDTTVNDQDFTSIPE